MSWPRPGMIGFAEQSQRDAERARCGSTIAYRRVASTHPLVLVEDRVRCLLAQGHDGPHQGRIAGSGLHAWS